MMRGRPVLLLLFALVLCRLTLEAGSAPYRAPMGW